MTRVQYAWLPRLVVCIPQAVRRYIRVDRTLALRDVAVVSVALDTGMRLVELARLDLADVVVWCSEDSSSTRDCWALSVRPLIGNPPDPLAHHPSRRVTDGRRLAILSLVAAEALLAYVAATGRTLLGSKEAATGDQDPLWLSSRGGRLCEAQLRCILRETGDLARACGAVAADKPVTAELLRRTVGVDRLSERGADASRGGFLGLSAAHGYLGGRALSPYSAHAAPDGLRGYALNIPGLAATVATTGELNHTTSLPPDNVDQVRPPG